jgi:hypothetical protein
MAKNSILDYSATPSNNADIGGIGIMGLNAVSNFDDAFRTLMAQMKTDLDYKQVLTSKSGGYTAVANDNNGVLRFTATATLALTAAATLGANWHLTVVANGGDVTIDPNGSETIGGATTYFLRNGGTVTIVCDGSNFLIVQRAGRARLQSNLTLYVSTTGSDSNNGLTPASAFLTRSRALSELVTNYDLNGYQVTVQLADGTYTDGLVATSNPIGGSAGTGSVIFKGNTATPANVLVAVTGASCFAAQSGAQFLVQDMKLQSAGAATNLLLANPGGIISFSNVIFGESVEAQINALGGVIEATGNYAIAGGAQFHMKASAFGKASANSRTVTLSGTPNYSSAFAYAQQGRVEAIGTTFSGAATGTRYLAGENGVVTTNGAGATALPGNAAGGVATGGQYV